MNNNVTSPHFERESKKTESLLTKIYRLLKIVQPIAVVVAAVALVIQCLSYQAQNESLDIQRNTSDAGKIIMQLYEESTQNSDAMVRMASCVDLPESLEQLPEVRKIRRLQNDMIRTSYLITNYLGDVEYISRKSDGISPKYNDISDIEKDSLITIVVNRLEVFKRIIENDARIKADLGGILESYGSDAITIDTFSQFFQKKSVEEKEPFMEKMEGLINESKKHSYDWCLDSIIQLVKDPQFKTYITSCREEGVYLMNFTNQRLLYLKNKCLDEEI